MKRDIQKPCWLEKLEHGFKPKTMIWNHCYCIKCAPIFCCSLNQLIIHAKLTKRWFVPTDIANYIEQFNVALNQCLNILDIKA